MAFDVFLSYSRDDTAACDLIYGVLVEFGMNVFLDRRSIGAEQWLSAIESALTGPDLPAVVVVASPAAASSPYVRQEVQWARATSRSRDVPILSVQLEPRAAGLAGLELDDFEAIDLDEDALVSGVSEQFKDELWLRLHVKPAGQILGGLRDRAHEWCARQLTSGVDFWGDAWLEYFPAEVGPGGSRVLIAQGGAGKSVLTAHFVRDLLARSPRCCPVIVDPDSLHNGLTDVATAIGARSPAVLTEHVERVRKSLDMEIIFVLDALDRAATTSDPDDIVAGLGLLSAASMLLVTCRSEAWQVVQDRIDLTVKTVAELPRHVVLRVLQGHPHLSGLDLRILHLPLYLDAVIRLQADFVEAPRTATDVLKVLWDSYATPKRDPGSPIIDTRRLLRALPQQQLRQMGYEVELGASNEDTLAAAALLEQRGALVVRRSGGVRRVRLRHDLLDCFGMVLLLLDQAGGAERRRELYARADEECGSAVLSVLAQVVADTSFESLTREVFTALLQMVDRKRRSSRHMARAWAATIVLSERFELLLPLILEALAGTVADPDPEGESRLNPDARVTQEAASSLASAFSAVSDWQHAAPDQAIPLLEHALDTWKYRRRMVEALGRYRSPAAAGVLERFARGVLLSPEGDLEVLGDVAVALGSIRQRTSLEVLEAIATHSDLDPRTRRAATEAKNVLTWPLGDPLPPVEEAEIIANLNPRDSRGDYSDWSLIRTYANHAEEWLATHDASPELIDALVRALQHDQTFARTPTARCLGGVDAAEARIALVAELREQSIPAEVRKACVSALARQIAAGESPPIRAARANLVSIAADRSTSSLTAERLTQLVDDAQSQDRLVITPSAFEVLSLRTRLGHVARYEIRRAEAEDVPAISAQASALITPDDLTAVGEAWESKVRICGFTKSRGGDSVITMTTSSWPDGAGFHRAVGRQDPLLSTDYDDLLHQSLRGDISLPGLAAVHAMVTTADGQLLMARRATLSHYAPRRWSTSLEEQMVEADFASALPAPAATAVRGLLEEFGITVLDPTTRIQLASVIMEAEILNLAYVVFVALPHGHDEIEDMWRGHAVAAGEREISEIRWHPLDPAQLRRTARGKGALPLHPTASVRMSIMAGWVDADLWPLT